MGRVREKVTVVMPERGLTMSQRRAVMVIVARAYALALRRAQVWVQDARDCPPPVGHVSVGRSGFPLPVRGSILGL
jgi:hypothetical protein